MEYKFLLICGLVGFSFSIQTIADVRSNSGRTTIAGRYISSNIPGNTMNITKRQNGYLVELEGGGEDSSAAGTSANCIIHAYGILKGNRMTATFEAVDTEIFQYTEEQAKSENRKLELKFVRGRANVLQADTLGYCGYGANFRGKYKRRNRH
jgi:hypothetical protein